MTQIDAVCEWCGDELPKDTKSTAKYCSTNHRVAAFRDRRRTEHANLDRFRASAVDHELRKRAALVSPPQVDAGLHDTWTPPPAPPLTPDPELLDPIDRWIRAPMRLND